jgi:hypothetical protein
MKLARAGGNLQGVLDLAAGARKAGVKAPELGEEIARAFLAAGRADNALGVLDRMLNDPAASGAPEAAPLWALRADILDLRADLDSLRAGAAARGKCLALRPLDPAAWQALAGAELRLGRALERAGLEAAALEQRRRARREAHAACAMAPEDPLPRLALAGAWRDLHQPAAARAALKEARSLGGAQLRIPPDLRALEIE